MNQRLSSVNSFQFCTALLSSYSAGTPGLLQCHHADFGLLVPLGINKRTNSFGGSDGDFRFCRPSGYIIHRGWNLESQIQQASVAEEASELVHHVLHDKQ